MVPQNCPVLKPICLTMPKNNLQAQTLLKARADMGVGRRHTPAARRADVQMLQVGELPEGSHRVPVPGVGVLVPLASRDTQPPQLDQLAQWLEGTCSPWEPKPVSSFIQSSWPLYLNLYLSTLHTSTNPQLFLRTSEIHP